MYYLCEKKSFCEPSPPTNNRTIHGANTVTTTVTNTVAHHGNTVTNDGHTNTSNGNTRPRRPSGEASPHATSPRVANSRIATGRITTGHVDTSRVATTSGKDNSRIATGRIDTGRVAAGGSAAAACSRLAATMEEPAAEASLVSSTALLASSEPDLTTEGCKEHSFEAKEHPLEDHSTPNEYAKERALAEGLYSIWQIGQTQSKRSGHGKSQYCSWITKDQLGLPRTPSHTAKAAQSELPRTPPPCHTAKAAQLGFGSFVCAIMDKKTGKIATERPGGKRRRGGEMRTSVV